MAIHYTTIGPIGATFRTDGRKADAEIVAFGWDDAEPEKVTGYWMLGKSVPGNLAFMLPSQILEMRG
jgi:hypothetical protein